MKQFVFIATIALILAGCNKQPKETEWGIFNEPVKAAELPETAGANEIAIQWEKKIGDAGKSGYAILRPAVVEGAVYAVNRSGEVSRFSSDDGSLSWRTDVSSQTFSGIGVGDGSAVIALDNGSVVSLDSESGEQRWQSKIKRQISSVPVVGAGRVVIRTADGSLFGLDSSDGSEVWRIQRDAPGLSVHGDSSPLISGDSVVAGLSNGRLLAVSVINGREFWETDLSVSGGTNELERLTDIDSQPLLKGSTLYAATYQGELVALDLNSSSESWREKISTRLAMDSDSNAIYVTDTKGEIVALDLSSGEPLWRQTGIRGRGVTNPIVRSNRILVGDADGYLHTLDSSTGDFLESRRLTRSPLTSLSGTSVGILGFSANGDLISVSLNLD